MDKAQTLHEKIDEVADRLSGIHYNYVQVKMDFLTYDEVQDIEYFEINIRRLMKERMKITQRGRLNEYEDLRLDEIDSELLFWEERIDVIFDAYYDELSDDSDA